MGPAAKPDALSWMYKGTPSTLYVNRIFSKRLLTDNISENEINIIIFAMAMCIVHEFGHSAVQWQNKTPTTPNTSQSLVSPIASSSNTQENTYVTPNIYKEAGRFVERKLFKWTIGLVCNKDPNDPNSQIWKESNEIVGKNKPATIYLSFDSLFNVSYFFKESF